MLIKSINAHIQHFNLEKIVANDFAIFPKMGICEKIAFLSKNEY